MEESRKLVNSIGILYICTGPYKLFWGDFYRSFEKYFLPEYEKHYYIFSDAEHEYFDNGTGRVHYCYIDNQPWPLITLLRFQTFLKQEKNLREHKLLMFCNANIVCSDYVMPKEILPNYEDGERLFFTRHPGYNKEKPWKVPYDRNRSSLAYIPYSRGKKYVIGAVFGGYSEAFLELTHLLHSRICEDLKKGVIAKWHDESHINHYVATHNDYRILNPGFCYPVGFDVPFEKKVAGVPKANVFDVNSFKGYYAPKRTSLFKSCIIRIKNWLNVWIIPNFCYIRDKLLLRKPAN